mgnify:FL=1
MEFQIYSDLHIEEYDDYPRLPVLKDYLILAGDIGKIGHRPFTQFLHYVNNNWKKVFYVLGNHEYYDNYLTYIELKEMYKNLFKNFNNIILLDKKKVELNNIEILGCTLWSYYPSRAPDNYVNYLQNIKEKKNHLFINDLSKDSYNKMNMEDKQWLLENYNPKKKTIIITHYPLRFNGTTHKKWENEIYKSIFANEINIVTNNILYCVSGHTHYSHNFKHQYENIYYISNQKGSKDERNDYENKFNEKGIYKLF